MLTLNYNRTQGEGLFCEGVSNDMVKIFPDSLNTVLSKIAMYWLCVYGKKTK